MGEHTGSVLFIDIVRYSAKDSETQQHLIHELCQAVRGCLDKLHPAWDAAKGDPMGPTILPTGDGMGIAFPDNLSGAIQCAQALADRVANIEELHIRMGADFGHYITYEDLSQRENAAGTTINNAQRVMDCGGAGHILCSDGYAQELIRCRHSYGNRFDRLPPTKDKHGGELRVQNYHDAERDVGNLIPPDWVRPVRIESPGHGSLVTSGPGGWDPSEPSIHVVVKGSVTRALEGKEITLARVVPGSDGRRLHWSARIQARDGRFEGKAWCGNDHDLRREPRVEVVAVAFDQSATSIFARLHNMVQQLNGVLLNKEKCAGVPDAFWRAVQCRVAPWMPLEDEVLRPEVPSDRTEFTLSGV